jgi:HlyD family secretion protein
MTANVTFVFANRDDVLRVPNGALRFRPSADLVSALNLEVPRSRRTSSDGVPGGGAAGSAGHSRKSGSADGEDAPEKRTVWVLRDDRPSSVRIKTGTSDGSKTEVVEGALQIGDVVISDATLPAGLKPAATGMLPGAGPPGGGPRRGF